MAPIADNNLSAQVLAFLREHQMVSPGDTVVVAVSGGADSLCLLYLLADLREPLRLRLVVGHLDHRLRQEASIADRAFVEAQCAALQVPFHARAVNVSALARSQKSSVEAAGRQTRYEFFRELAQETGAARVATGHTASDQAETVLLNLIRGAGTLGLSGMRPVRDLAPGIQLIRPLLTIQRSDTEAFCQARVLEPRQDHTNLDDRFRRVWVRRRVLPLLREANPNVDAALVRSAAALREDSDALDAIAASIPIQRERNRARISLPAIQSLPPAVQVRVLRRAFQELGQPVTPETVHITAWRRALAPGFGGTIQFPGGLQWTVEGALGVLGEPRSRPAPLIGGCLIVDGPAVRFGRSRVSVRATAVRVPADEPMAAFIDADQLEGELCVRAPRPDDHFRPPGLGAATKVTHFLAGARVSAHARMIVPVVVCGRRVVWVGGHRLDERFLITEATRRIIRIGIEPDHDEP